MLADVELCFCLLYAMLFANEKCKKKRRERKKKTATDVFFRHSSKIKEALVAFLMRHVNFIKCVVESERATAARESLMSVSLSLWQPVFAPVYFTSPPLTCSCAIKAGHGASYQKGLMSDVCVYVWVLDRFSAYPRWEEVSQLKVGHSSMLALRDGWIPRSVENECFSACRCVCMFHLGNSRRQEIRPSHICLSCTSGRSSAYCVFF